MSPAGGIEASGSGGESGRGSETSIDFSAYERGVEEDLSTATGRVFGRASERSSSISGAPRKSHNLSTIDVRLSTRSMRVVIWAAAAGLDLTAVFPRQS